MKNVLLFLSFFSISFNAVCQTKILKGDWTVGGRLGLTSTSVTGSSSSTLTYEADPNVGYFLRNGLAGGIEMTFLKSDYNLFVASPFIRYYVFPSDKIFNLSLQGSYGWGVYKQYIYTDNVNQFSFFISPTAFFSPSAAFKLTLGYVSIGISGINERINSLSVGGGFPGILLISLFRRLPFNISKVYFAPNLFLMKRILVTALLFVSFSSFAQTNINKGNIMVGGTAAFASTSISDFEGSVTTIKLEPNLGYFFADRFAGGLAISTESTSSDGDFGNGKESQFLVSPFLRYYFLPSTQKVNVFLTAQYGFGSISETDLSGQSQSAGINAYGFSAGPAIFINPAVALEFSVNYISTGGEAFGNMFRSNTIGVGLGFQIHLGK